MSQIAKMLEAALTRHRRGELAEAEHVYRQIVERDPRNADALHLLGVAAHQRGNCESAAGHIERALRIDAGHASFHSNLGAVYRELGRIDAAVACYQQAIQIDPATAGYRYNLANALKEHGRFGEAVKCYQEAIDLDPNFAEAFNNLGDALKSLGRYDDAIESHRRAIEIRPDFADAWFNLGNAQRRAERFDAAAVSYRRAVTLNPDFVDAWINLGYTCEDRGVFNEAIESYEAALRVRPDCADAHFNRALSWLQLGEYAQGWAEYEWRWQRTAKDRPRPAGLEWDGSPLAGRSIHVYNEQGIGDELMFASCLPDLLARQPEAVNAECDPRLVPLLGRSFPSIRFIARRGHSTNDSNHADVSASDLHVALGSLPRYFRNSAGEFPVGPAYLRADATLTAHWRARYCELGEGLTIGISWKGGRDETVRRRRSTAIEQWGPLFDLPGIQFVNLQYGDCRTEIESAQQQFGVTIHDWPDADPLNDLDGFAAKIAALDLVISIDNSTVHLAGGLGVPVWTLLPFSADWRWLLGRDDSPWYPTMKLFRQPAFGDWDAVFNRVTADLAERTAQAAAESGRLGATFASSSASAIDETRIVERQEAGALNDRAIELQTQGRLDEALAHLLKARELAPCQSLIPFNLGNLLRRMNAPRRAVACYDDALAIDPTSIETQVNRGVALREAGRLADAESAFDHLLTQSPELPTARFNRALVRLQRGDFANGWPDYEYRWRTGEAADPNARLLTERIALAGRNLLVRAEQGVGDEIMFASCLPEVVDEADSCIIECDRRLAPLFARSFPAATVLQKPVDINRPIRRHGDPQPLEWDLCLPCGSLPMIERPDGSAFPKRASYLVPDAQRVAEWRRRFAGLGTGLAVGISWSGGKDAVTRQRRSVPLPLWRELFDVSGAHFVNLQYGQSPSELHRQGRELDVDIHHWRDSDPLANLDDFAAQITALDLVISVDNSTVHLAGAVGTNVWTLLPASADWRWMHDRDDSPWYPTMRLLRQPESRDWSGIIRQAGEQLSALRSAPRDA